MFTFRLGRRKPAAPAPVEAPPPPRPVYVRESLFVTDEKLSGKRAEILAAGGRIALSSFVGGGFMLTVDYPAPEVSL